MMQINQYIEYYSHSHSLTCVNPPFAHIVHQLGPVLLHEVFFGGLKDNFESLLEKETLDKFDKLTMGKQSS